MNTSPPFQFQSTGIADAQNASITFRQDLAACVSFIQNGAAATDWLLVDASGRALVMDLALRRERGFDNNRLAQRLVPVALQGHWYNVSLCRKMDVQNEQARFTRAGLVEFGLLRRGFCRRLVAQVRCV
ncbi:MAG: hypothetical protein IPJ85_16255 [Flavobacteriales bacterium]|nr:hypothetical protein [Flavobacteriales bacterium]